MRISFRESIFQSWSMVFGRPYARRLNYFLLHLATRGLGVGNVSSLSGEEWILKKLAPRWRSQGGTPVLFDVGANEGDYSALLACLCPEARVLALEPHPSTAKRLEERFGGKVAVHATAIGDVPGRATLWDYAQKAGSEHASMVPGVIEQLHLASSVGVEVAVTTLDSFCAEHGLDRIDLLKLDVEGLEAACLRGARGLIAGGAIGIVQFEFNSMHVMARTFFTDFVELLPGFRFYRLLPFGLLELRPVHVLRCHLYHIQNIFAVSPAVIAQDPKIWEC